MRIHIDRRLQTSFLLLGVIALTMLTVMPGNSIIFRVLRKTIVATKAGEFLAHAAVFGLLAILCYAIASFRFSRPQALLLACSTALLLGAGTELVQMIVPGRTGSLIDLTADSIGIFTFVLCMQYRRVAVASGRT